MDEPIVIFGMFAVTYFSRALPMLKEFKIENRYIKYIPPSIFAALVFPDVTNFDEKTLAALIVLLVSLKNRNLLLAMFVGVLSLYVLQKAEIF
ncbi:branched-chain amino acid transport [Ferroglobus placidus DSM 10642]|uniref:Branched-chain amino acid transport n=1 Tax=Ferroglobus placidus (strain DSM 10642 / AEDII12DO) TaxID=589924 RepID=D3RWP6_FERPA|nr:AzlD domain-containing protein [Ferroglobus placidus]ADC64909.1 branched-chain amino acid transport [Ferroglobus placidus DSM 10642]